MSGEVFSFASVTFVGVTEVDLCSFDFRSLNFSWVFEL